MDVAAGAIYVDKHFDVSDKAEVSRKLNSLIFDALIFHLSD